MHKINICSIDEEGRFGGPERRIVEIARALIQHNIKTHIIYPILDSERFQQEIKSANTCHTAIGITRLTKEKKLALIYILKFIFEIILLYSFFKKNKFDIIQVNGSQQFKGAIAASFAKIPVIWVLEDAQMNLLVKKLSILLIKVIAHGIIITGKNVYDYYLRDTTLVNKPIVEINPPVDTKLFNPQRVISKKIKSLNGKINIVTLTGFNPTKGLEYFIEMAAQLVERYEEVRFIIAGAKLNSHKRYYNTICNLINSNNFPPDYIQVNGLIDDVPSFLKDGHIFVCTSNSETGPMVVWEAMSMEKAVVSTDVGAVRKYITDGESGFIVPTKDAVALGNRVELLLNNPSLRVKMGKKARIIMEKSLNTSIIAQKYASFYKLILRS